jgi:hypothetical protein
LEGGMTTTAVKPLLRDSERTVLQSQLNAALDSLGMRHHRTGAVLVKVDAADGPAPAMGWYTPGAADITFHVGEFLKLHPELTPEQLVSTATGMEGWATTRARNAHGGGGTKEQNRIRKAIAGLLLHEGGHSRHSDWTMEPGFKATLAVINTLMIFEEGRIEKRVVDMNNSSQPKFRVKEYLRAIAQVLLAGTPEKYETLGHAMAVWALVKGRTSAGTLTPEEFAPIDNALRAHLGDDLMDELTDIYDEAMAIDARRDFERLVELAEQWNEALSIPSDGEGEGEAEGGCSHKVKEDAKGEKGKGESDEEGEEGDGEGDDSEEGDGEPGDGKAKGKPEELGDGESDEKSDDDTDSGEFHDVEDLVIVDGKANTSVLSDDGLASFRKAINELVESETLAEAPMMDTADKRKATKDVFETTPNYEGSKWRVRKPTPYEVSASNKLASHLESMMVPTIAGTKVLTDVPTGRLKSREAVRRSAERSQGRMTTAKPWVDKIRKHALGPPAIVGIATDTSGSMAWAQGMVASAAYIVGKAGHRINAKTAAVTFGSQIEAVLKPGEVPTEVRERSADGGVEEFDVAMAALDGALGLTTTPDTAKVLVIISDNELVNTFEPERRAIWMDRFAKAGVSIVWVDQTVRKVANTEGVAIRWRDITDAEKPMVLVDAISKALDKAFTTKRGRY